MESEALNPRLYLILERTFKTIGWALILLLVFSSIMALSAFRRSFLDDSNWMAFGFDLPRSAFSIVKELRTFFDGLSSVFFAFLASSIFRMARKRKPVKSKQTKKFMQLCCTSFLALGILNLVSWIGLTITGAPGSILDEQFFSWFSLATWIAGRIAILVESLIPFLYASAIFATYHHFSGLITFESEVA